MKFFATTAKGMEELLLGELTALGAVNAKATRAGVTFEGPIETAYRACLWSRVANRILLPLATFPAPNPEKLYGNVRSIRWLDHLDPSDTIAVDFQASQSQITHTHFGALKVKDAIVDLIRAVKGTRPSVDTQRPSVRVNVYLNRDEATVSIDLSGDSLHLRGYREEASEAPLKENLAAAMLLLAEWPKLALELGSEACFLDPMCGSGTLPVEAAMIGAKIAPGISRTYWGFQGWKQHDAALWERLVAEAREGEVRDKKRAPRVVGYDQDFRVIPRALANLERAGLRGFAHIEKRELDQAERIGERGIFCVNPPYGERLGETEALKPLYKRIGDTMKQKFQGWNGYVLTSNPDLAKVV
ncbi:MAG: THUMP domain-containing class I SAM-dependent RNA methyltransferase, partial [Bdellovibrionota bacterium]